MRRRSFGIEEPGSSERTGKGNLPGTGKIEKRITRDATETSTIGTEIWRKKKFLLTEMSGRLLVARESSRQRQAGRRNARTESSNSNHNHLAAEKNQDKHSHRPGQHLGREGMKLQSRPTEENRWRKLTLTNS
jgi:hypothetical protein